MIVAVTQQDIDNGLRRSFTHGAVNTALRRAFQKALDDKRTFQVLIPVLDFAFVHGHIVELPEKVQIFIKRHDDRLPVKPFSFDLPDPQDDLFQVEYAK